MASTTPTTKINSFLTKFFSLLILLLHLGCFLFTPSIKNTRKERKISSCLSSSSSRFKPQKAWSFIKHIISKSSSKSSPHNVTLTSARSSKQSLVSMIAPDDIELPIKISSESDISSGDNNSIFLPMRNDIFPCTICGEIFQKGYNLEQHKSVRHAVTELFDGESGKNIVRIIFKTGWTNMDKSPDVHRVLKIHNSSKTLSRFEEYREFVKEKAANNRAFKLRDERCIADGNELLRFYCTTFMCDLGQNGNSSLCTQQYCSTCGIIKSGFSPKMDGISTLSSSWRGHVSIPEEIEEEFKFMNVKRAMLICRVIAGRVGFGLEDVDKEDGGFDSIVGRGRGSGVLTRVDEEELLVFSPRAVLPCFVIVYNV
ncbi:hypothetical protein ACFE04_015584 [Oxalis oulophora]